MNHNSCQNCWFNGLQYGALGFNYGYCSKKNIVLLNAENTTCNQQIRKDLTIERAIATNKIHANFYKSTDIVKINKDPADKNDYSTATKEINFLRKNNISDAAVNYGALSSKIESLAMLNQISGAKSELAFLSLSRGYANNCFNNDQKWTSALHLFWWTKSRITTDPEINFEDIRFSNLRLSKQSELLSWSIIMLRLTFLDDVAWYAKKTNYSPLGELVGIPSRVTSAVQSFNSKKTLSWIKNNLLPTINEALPYEEYKRISNTLHK